VNQPRVCFLGRRPIRSRPLFNVEMGDRRLRLADFLRTLLTSACLFCVSVFLLILPREILMGCSLCFLAALQSERSHLRDYEFRAAVLGSPIFVVIRSDGPVLAEAGGRNSSGVDAPLYQQALYRVGTVLG
jgi:hypothetical protein